jgi:hypothetical protein
VYTFQSHQEHPLNKCNMKILPKIFIYHFITSKMCGIMYVLVKTVTNNESWWDTVLFPKIKCIRTRVSTILFHMTVNIITNSSRKFLHNPLKLCFTVINTIMKCIKGTSEAANILIIRNIFRLKVRSNHEGQSCGEIRTNFMYTCICLTLPSIVHNTTGY